MAQEATTQRADPPTVPSEHGDLGGHETAANLWGFLTKPLRILLTGTAFLLFGAGAVYLALVVFPLIALAHWRAPPLRARRSREAISRALRFHLDYMRRCGLITFDARSFGAQLPRGPFVLVANHPTLVDAVLLLGAHPTLYCVAKGPLFRNPIIGRLLRQAGHINAGDGAAQAGAAVALAALRRLRSGDPVLIFPEGTRSPEGGVGHFKSGAFDIASRAGVPLVPLLIRSWPRGLMRGVPWYSVPDSAIRFELSILPVPDTNRPRGDAEMYSADTEHLFERLLRNPSAWYDPPND